jgi:hypothetical protein
LSFPSNLALTHEIEVPVGGNQIISSESATRAKALSASFQLDTEDKKKEEDSYQSKQLSQGEGGEFQECQVFK